MQTGAVKLLSVRATDDGRPRRRQAERTVAYNVDARTRTVEIYRANAIACRRIDASSGGTAMGLCRLRPKLSRSPGYRAAHPAIVVPNLNDGLMSLGIVD